MFPMWEEKLGISKKAKSTRGGPAPAPSFQFPTQPGTPMGYPGTSPTGARPNILGPVSTYDSRYPAKMSIGGTTLPTGLRAMPWQTPAPGVTQATTGPTLREGMWDMYGAFSPIPDYVEPTPPPVQPSRGGGGYAGGGGAGAPVIVPLNEVAWRATEFDLQNANAPGWWKPVVPANADDMKRPDVAYLAMLNSTIPYLSPEDQRNAAAQLYAADADNFSFYKPGLLEGATPITRETALLSEAYKKDPSKYKVLDRGYFQSSGRASGYINLLSQLREQTVGGERSDIAGTGIPYTWLQQVAGMVERFGSEPTGGTSMTRAKHLAMISAIDPLMAQGKSQEVGPALAIGQMFAQPFFSQGSLMPVTEGKFGKFFGKPNPMLF